MRKLPRSCREEYGKHHMPSLHLLWKWHRNTKCSYLAIIMWNNEGVIEQIFFTLTIKKIATYHWSNIHDLSSSFQLWLGIGKKKVVVLKFKLAGQLKTITDEFHQTPIFHAVCLCHLWKTSRDSFSLFFIQVLLVGKVTCQIEMHHYLILLT